VKAERNLASRVREAALLEGDFVLSSGKKSRFYVDKYLFSTEPALLRDLAYEISGRLPAGTRRLAGVELGSVPLVAAAALESGLSYGIVRKSTKGYGTGNRIEGRPFESGEKVVLIDDVVTSGASAIEAAQGLRGAGLVVEELVVLIERDPAARRELAQAGIRLHPVTTLEALVADLTAVGAISTGDAEAAEEFIRP